MGREVWADPLPAWFYYLLKNFAAMYVPAIPLLFLDVTLSGRNLYELAMLPTFFVFASSRIFPEPTFVLAFWAAIVLFSILFCRSPRRRFYTFLLFALSATQASIILLYRALRYFDGA